jgi:hypothetical protein
VQDLDRCLTRIFVFIEPLAAGERDERLTKRMLVSAVDGV